MSSACLILRRNVAALDSSTERCLLRHKDIPKRSVSVHDRQPAWNILESRSSSRKRLLPWGSLLKVLCKIGSHS